MTVSIRLSALLTAPLLLSVVMAPMDGLARGGGGGRGGAGRAGYHYGGGTWNRGYQGAHPLYGDNVRPGTDPEALNRNINLQNNFYGRDFNGWRETWRNGGYWADRPWRTGWYGGWTSWTWWPESAAAWGVAGLATGAVITGLLNDAADNSSPSFLVPGTSYELNYASVEAVGLYGASFSYSINGSSLMGAVDCQQGLLNGQRPGTSGQAQLLNALCQVADGAG